MIAFYCTKGLLWLRLWDGRPGFLLKDTRLHKKLFSERNNYTKHSMIGPWLFRWIKNRGI